jgi:hypothetical protein
MDVVDYGIIRMLRGKGSRGYERLVWWEGAQSSQKPNLTGIDWETFSNHYHRRFCRSPPSLLSTAGVCEMSPV